MRLFAGFDGANTPTKVNCIRMVSLPDKNVLAELPTATAPRSLLVAQPFLFAGLAGGEVLHISLTGAGQDSLTGHVGAITMLALFGTCLITASLDQR